MSGFTEARLGPICGPKFAKNSPQEGGGTPPPVAKICHPRAGRPILKFSIFLRQKMYVLELGFLSITQSKMTYFSSNLK